MPFAAAFGHFQWVALAVAVSAGYCCTATCAAVHEPDRRLPSVLNVSNHVQSAAQSAGSASAVDGTLQAVDKQTGSQSTQSAAGRIVVCLFGLERHWSRAECGTVRP